MGKIENKIKGISSDSLERIFHMVHQHEQSIPRFAFTVLLENEENRCQVHCTDGIVERNCVIMVSDAREDLSQELLKNINELSSREIVSILLKLCKEHNLSEQAILMAKKYLSEVHMDEIANEVFASLNSIQVEDVWNNSGKTRWGYQDPSEVACDMFKEEIEQYMGKMRGYNDLGMKREEKIYCMGIISGLLQYGEDGNNEFYDYVPDEPYTIAEDILYDWKKNNSNKDIADVQKVYDSYRKTDTW